MYGELFRGAPSVFFDECFCQLRILASEVNRPVIAPSIHAVYCKGVCYPLADCDNKSVGDFIHRHPVFAVFWYALSHSSTPQTYLCRVEFKGLPPAAGWGNPEHLQRIRLGACVGGSLAAREAWRGPGVGFLNLPRGRINKH